MKRNICGSDCVFETQVVDFENLQRKIYDSFHSCFWPLESIVGILHKRKEKENKEKTIPRLKLVSFEKHIRPAIKQNEKYEEVFVVYSLFGYKDTNHWDE